MSLQPVLWPVLRLFLDRNLRWLVHPGWHPVSLPSSQSTFAGSQLSSVSILSTTQTAGTLPSTQLSIVLTITSFRGGGDAPLAMLDHRDLVVSLSSDASKLLAVSEHLEEVVTTQNPVETQTFTPLSGLYYRFSRWDQVKLIHFWLLARFDW